MSGIASLRSLLDAPVVTSDEGTISLFLGRTLDEVSDWPMRPDTMLDGLDRSKCHEAVRMRALRLLGDETMAACVAEMTSTLVPLARTMQEVDAAIDACAGWMASLQTDHLLTRIVDAKCEAEEDPLRLADPETLDEDQRALLEARDEVLDEIESDGTLVLSFGDLDAIITVETNCIMIMVQTTPGSDEFVILYSFEHVEQDEDPDGGDDPEPEPEDGPRPLIAA